MKKVVGLGEVLWDILPEGSFLGGAPANFAYITTLLGDEGIVASRVGDDGLGLDARHRMRALGLNTDYVQTDGRHATGTVNVKVASDGIPQYDIAHPVAWDFLEWTPKWKELAGQADAVCFGSLAQRSEETRNTIRAFLRASFGAVKVFDVNLRQAYYSRDVVVESMQMAKIVKLNDEELPKIFGLCELPRQDEVSSARMLMAEFDLDLVCITRGGNGSLLVRSDETNEHPGFRVRVADTVGAGDAFTAGLVHEFLRGAALDRMNATANRVGAWVASEVGAMPRPRNQGQWLAEIR